MCRLIAKDGIHQGFDLMAWSVVGLQIFGGLIVGMVVKYADNILKNFANALSVIFTVLGAMPLFGQYPSPWFIVGVSLVSLSVFMYGKSAPQVRSPPRPRRDSDLAASLRNRTCIMNPKQSVNWQF